MLAIRLNKKDIDDQEIRLNWCNHHRFDNWN